MPFSNYVFSLLHTLTFEKNNSCLSLSKCGGHRKKLFVKMANNSEDEESDYFDEEDDDFEPIFSEESDSDSEIDLSVDNDDISYIEIVENVAENIEQEIYLSVDNDDISHIEIVENVAENNEQNSVSLWSDYTGRQKCFDFTGIVTRFVLQIYFSQLFFSIFGILIDR